MNRDHRLLAIRELPSEMLADDALGLASLYAIFPISRCAFRLVVEGHAAGEVYRKESNDWARKEASRS